MDAIKQHPVPLSDYKNRKTPIIL